MQPWQGDLLDWYEVHARPLPWRRTQDPYRILVSEVMAQQTQVSRVVPAFRQFLEAFPTVQALAAASLAEVLRSWAGLGYNRRARQLHEAARLIVERHDGLVPERLAELRALPGIGPYTARAVQAFAFGQDAAPVDTNIARVLSRVVGARHSPAGLQDLADRLVPSGRAGAWSSALMDLGAAVCTARPLCPGCPLAGACSWRRAGGADPAARRRGSGTFHGSDRFHRGRLVAALRHGPVPQDRIAAAMQLEDDTERAAQIARDVVGDGLAEWDDGALRLPG